MVHVVMREDNSIKIRGWKNHFDVGRRLKNIAFAGTIMKFQIMAHNPLHHDIIEYPYCT